MILEYFIHGIVGLDQIRKVAAPGMTHHEHDDLGGQYPENGESSFPALHSISLNPSMKHYHFVLPLVFFSRLGHGRVSGYWWSFPVGRQVVEESRHVEKRCAGRFHCRASKSSGMPEVSALDKHSSQLFRRYLILKILKSLEV